MPQSRPCSILAIGLATLMLPGCAGSDRNRGGLFQPYRIDVPQGNYVDQRMLDQVLPGMTREQVRFALGTPLLIDPFRPDRWDYVFRYQHANGDASVRRATVFFADNRVARVEASELPADDGTDPALPGYQRRQGRFR
jgi:outer membrane protein assembly factor BamE